MATIITREVGATAKGTTLTNAEIDNNFINLNNELSAKANTASPTLTGTVTVGKLSVLSPGGDEGGEINLALAQTNNLLNGSVAIDINQNQLRIFETGGTNRGVFINLASAGASVGTNLLANAPIAAADVPNLDASKITTGTIAAARLPSYVDDVLEAANLAAFPATGETGKIYVALDTNKTYRWSGSAYVYITSGAVDSVAGKTGVVTLVKGDVGLGSVDNTADSAKNVLSATKLTTARTIGGVSFDGTVNINLPGVNAAGNQNTTGNAGTATTLQTARNINGTSFNGSADITTANWGTARTLTIGNTGKSVNGSGNVSWSVAEIGAGTGHVYGYTATYSVPAAMAESWFKISDAYNSVVYFSISSSYDNTMHEDHVVATVFGYNMKHHLSSTTSDYNVGRLLEIKTNNNGSAGTTEIWARFGAATGAGQITIKSSHVIPTLVPATPTFGGTGIVSLLFDTTTRTTSSLLITRGIRIDGNVTLHAGNYNSYSPTLTGTGASGSWGISVTGSSASTTGNAASATRLINLRTINGVGFDGTANITVADSTKLPLTGGTLTGPLVVTSTGGSATDGLIINSNGASGVHITPASVDTTQSGRLFFTTGTAGQGFSVRNSAGSLFIQSGATYGSSSGSTVALSLSQAGALNTAGAITQNGSQVLTAGNYNSYAPTLTGTGASGSWGISVTGNAATATTLQTARDINGTSFNGSANITTANWGTARTLTIGNTGKSVNGSANVTWTAQEIGVFPIVSGQVTISNAAFTNAFFVTGDALASAIRFTVHGTSGGNVIASTIDAVVNHSQDIMITSLSGVYTLLSVKIISNDNDQFVVQLSTNSATATTCNIQVQPLNSESVTFTGITAPTGSTLTHVCQPGYAISGTGGNSGDIRSAGTIYAPTFSGSLSGNASTVTNGLVSTGSYADPAWITSLASSKLTGTIDNARLNGGTYTINVTGNAGTATTLQTARTIGGVSFNGSANINLPGVNTAGNQSTTGNAATATALQTARTFAIDSFSNYGTPTFNGSGNLTLSGVKIYPDSTTTFNTGVSGYGNSMGMVYASDGPAGTSWYRYIQMSYTSNTTNVWQTQIANSGTALYFRGREGGTLGDTGWGTWNTLIHNANYNSYSPTLTGGGASGTWGISITGSAATLTTARTLTIGSTGKTFNGSANVAWSLAEIGAAAASHTHDDRYFTEAEADARYIENNAYIDFTVAGDANTYYPVLLSGSKLFAWGSYSVTRGYSWTAPDTWNNATHKGGLTLNFRWSGDTGWGGNDQTITVEEFNETYSTMVGGMVQTTSGLIVFLRGGTAQYRFYSPNGDLATATVNLSGYTASNGTVYANRTNNSGNSEIYAKWPVRGTTLWSRGYQTIDTNNYTSYSPTLTGSGASGTWGISVTGSSASTTGNAATATALQNARTINGVSFNGTANITVADSTKLPLSGGTLTGKLISNGNDAFRLFESQNASASSAVQFFIEHNLGSVNIGNARGNINISSGNLLHGGNQVLHASNYTSYSPSLTGTGASGSWGISVTGSAATFTSTTQNSQFNSIGVGTAASATAGEIRATNNVTAYYSDMRLKKLISVIPNALDKVNSLSGVIYKDNEIANSYGYNNPDEQVGVLAQQVEAVMPQVIKPAPFDIAADEHGNEYSKSGQNYKTVQYEKLVPLLIEAIKELTAEVNQLKAKANL